MYCNESRTYRGYSINLLNELAKRLHFDYDIVSQYDHFGHMAPNGSWDKVMKDLIDREVDIGLGSMSVTAEREAVIDFTVPFYDLVGITIMMKKAVLERTVFRFLAVLETDVWLCIIATYFGTRFDPLYLSSFNLFASITQHPSSLASCCGYSTNSVHSAIKIT